MKKLVLTVALTTGLLGLTACGNGDSETIVESKVGNITKDELYTAMKDRYGEAVIKEMVYEKVLADKYEVTDKEVTAKLDELKKQMGTNFDMALQSSGYKSEDDFKRALKLNLLQEKAAIADIKVTEDELKTAYKNAKPEIKARHILVADEKTAKEVIAKLDKGEDFATLAKKYSTDPGSAQNGGDLGWFGAGKMVPEFEAAAYALKKNEISKPIKTTNGYHVIQLTDKKEKESYEKMKTKLEYDLKVSKIDQAKVQTMLDKLVKDAEVDVKDKDLAGSVSTDAATK